MVIVWSCLVWLNLVALYNLLTAIRLEDSSWCVDDQPSDPRKKVSLLIPVRNEARNLPRLIHCLSRLAYAPLEIIFLDDESTDDTARILADSGFRTLSGVPAPAGWVGKNWACHQLAKAATGELLLFCDADVAMADRSVADTVRRLHEHGARALTALPRQSMRSWSDLAVIPLVMHQPIAGLLPLNLLHYFHSRSLLVCNGQWLCFDRTAYFSIGGHERVRGSFVEDMALGRELKRNGYRLLTVVAADSLTVRMYEDWGNLKEGFTKNLYPLMGGNAAIFCLCLFLFVVANGLSFLTAPGLLLLTMNRLLVARLFRGSVLSVVTHPVGVILVFYLSVRSFFKCRWGTLTWKGRKTHLATSSSQA